MNNDRQVINFITDLIKRTSKKELTWIKIDPPYYLENGTEDLIPICYKTVYDNINFILYIRRYKHFTDYDEYFWGEEIKIAKLEPDGRISWVNRENISSLSDLFIIVEEYSSGMNDFFSKF